MPEDKRPTEQYIEATAKHLEDVWAKSVLKWKKTDGFIHGTFPVWDETKHPDRPAVRPATGRSRIDAAVDTQLPYEPQFHRDPINESATQKEAADRVENWLSAVWEQASLLEAVLPAKQAARHLVSYGYAILEGPYVRRSEKPMREEDESDEDYEVRLSDWFPFRMRAPHPSRILLPPMEKRPSHGIKRVKHYAKDLHDLTYSRLARNKKALVDVYDYGLEPWKLVDTIEYFSKKWHALMTSSQSIERGGAGRLLFVERNTDGFVPSAHGFSGWGQEPTDMTEIDPSYAAQGILDPVLDTLLREAQRKSGLHNALIQMAFAKMGSTKNSTEAALALQGDIVEGEEGDYWWLKYPDMPNWMFTAGEEIAREIEEGTFSLMQSGFRQEGVNTVGQQAILMNKSNLKFQVITKQMEDMASVIAGNFLRQAYRMETIPIVRGNKISHEDIGNRYHIRATFELVDPVLALQEREMAMREFQAGLNSREGYWEAARVKDTSTRKRQLLEDIVHQMPEVAAEEVFATMEKVGFADLVERLKAQALAQKAAEQAAQANGGAPAGPSVTEGLPSEEPASPMEPGRPATALREMRKPLTSAVPGQPQQPRVPSSARP